MARNVIHNAVQKISDGNQGRKSSCVILLMGITGAGKSEFIDSFTGENELGRFRGHEHRYKTRQVQQTRLHWLDDETKGYFVEMPSFLNEPPSDGVILQEIATFLTRIHDLGRLVGVIYLHDFSPGSVDQGMEEHLAFVRAIIGKRCNSTVLVLNKYGPAGTIYNLERATAVETIWRRQLDSSTPIHVNPEIPGSPVPIVRSLLGNHDVTPQLQAELLKKKLRKTTAGRLYMDQLKGKIEAKKQWVKSLKLVARDGVPMEHFNREKTALEHMKRELKQWKG